MRRILKSPFFILIVVAVTAGSSCGLFSGLLTKDVGGALAIAGIVVLAILAPVTTLHLMKALSTSNRALLDRLSPEDQPRGESASSRGQVARDRQRLRELASNPENRLQTASLMVLLIASLNIAVGWVAWVFQFEFLQSAGIGFGSILMGVVFLVLSIFSGRGSLTALVIAAALYALDGISAVAFSGYSWSMAVGHLFLLVPILRGIGAKRAIMKQGKGVLASGEGAAPHVGKALPRQRFFAFAIDLGIVGVVEGAWVLAGGSALWLVGIEQTPVWPVVLWGVIAAAMPATYFAQAYSTSGQTLGKRALQIRVVPIDGAPLTWAKGILRTVSYLLSGLPFGWGFLLSLWDADRQAGHDKIAGTLVVRDSVEREQLQGTLEPAEIHRRRKQWLTGLGISSLLMAVGIFVQILRILEWGEMVP
jgi:uncharacterized RDD family membrane protein YckC